METLKKICAWCDKVLQEGTGNVSHGICDECVNKYFPEKEIAA